MTNVFDTIAAPFRMQPGLQRLETGSTQLTPSDLESITLSEKLKVLSSHAAHAFAVAADFDAGPALRALMAQAATEHPSRFEWDGAERFEALALGWAIRGSDCTGDGPAKIGGCLRALPPAWRLTGLLSLALEEDFAVIDGANACIPWIAVCLPSRWAPEEKVGRHFAEVHAPVADNRLLIVAAEHLARLVTGHDRWERFVWTITADARLAQHPRHAAPVRWQAGDDADVLAAAASFRSERQTFIPMPDVRQAVFTIRVESRPLTEAFDSHARAQQVHDALASMSPAVLAYRDLTDARMRLLRWLAARAASE
jgi:dimethylamine monooxygenase subunit A